MAKREKNKKTLTSRIYEEISPDFKNVPFFKLLERLAQLLLRVHDDGPVPGDRLLQRLAGDQQEADAVVAGLHGRLRRRCRRGPASGCRLRWAAWCRPSRRLRSAPPAGRRRCRIFRCRRRRRRRRAAWFRPAASCACRAAPRRRGRSGRRRCRPPGRACPRSCRRRCGRACRHRR